MLPAVSRLQGSPWTGEAPRIRGALGPHLGCRAEHVDPAGSLNVILSGLLRLACSGTTASQLQHHGRCQAERPAHDPHPSFISFCSNSSKAGVEEDVSSKPTASCCLH